jgi:elongation factor G
MVLLWVGIDPKTPADREKLGVGLQRLIAADAALAVRTDHDGTTKVGADTQERLEVALHRLAREFGVEARITGLEIAYKETLTRAAFGECKYARQSGGRGQYGHVRIEVRPGAASSGFVFDNAIVGGAIPAEFIEPIAEGLREACSRGVLAGYPIEDVYVRLYDGSYHDVDSSADAFKIAGAVAFADAAKKAQPVLLEPIMQVLLIVPDEHESRAEAILSARRGVLVSARSSSDWTSVWAAIPLSETFGLEADLSQRTEGRGLCHLRFMHYAPAALADDDGDRDTPVREPKHPRTPPLILRASVPEPPPDFE